MWHKSLQDLQLSNDSWEWISNTGSLTKFLEKQAGLEKLCIHLIEQSWRTASSEQIERLNMARHSKILERKIVMTVMNRPWMFARTYFTEQASNYFGYDLNNLACKSLGNMLSENYPELYRGEFEYAFLDRDNHFYHNMIELLKKYKIKIDLTNNIISNKFIMRRSIFYLKNVALLNIDEIFLPDLINSMLKLEVSVI